MSDTTNEDVQTLVSGLCSQQKLLRDRGLGHLKSALSNLSSAAVDDLVANFLNIIEENER